MLQLIRELLAHCEWANAVYFHTWGKGPARDNEELRKRMEHILGVQRGFLAVVRGEGGGRPPEQPLRSYDELRAWAQEVHQGLNEFAAGMSADDLSRRVRIPWFGSDPPCEITVGEALVQAALHTQHHRGQCMTRLKDFGGEPKNVDWIIWLWKQKPESRWG